MKLYTQNLRVYAFPFVVRLTYLLLQSTFLLKYCSNDVSNTDPNVSPHKPVPFTYDSSSLMSDLPDGYFVHHFSHSKLLRTCAKILLDSLQSRKPSGLWF